MEADVLLIYMVVGIILIIIVFGLLIWAVVTTFKGGNKGRRTSVPAGVQPVQGQKAAVPGAARSSLGADMESSPPLTPRSKDIELLKICRDFSTGSVYVEMDGKQYRKLADIHDPQTGRLLLQTVADLNRFTRGVVPAVQTSATAGGSAPQPHGVSLLQPREATEEPASSKLGSLAQRGAALIDNAHPEKVEPGAVPPHPSSLLQRAYRMPDTEARPKGQTAETKAEEKTAPAKAVRTSAESKRNLGSFWGRALAPANAVPAAIGPRPLADELEDILTRLVDEMPEQPRHQIHFRTATDGRLIIDVDGTPYEDVNAIQDADVTQVIRTVIGRWEKR